MPSSPEYHSHLTERHPTQATTPAALLRVFNGDGDGGNHGPRRKRYTVYRTGDLACLGEGDMVGWGSLMALLNWMHDDSLMFGET